MTGPLLSAAESQCWHVSQPLQEEDLDYIETRLKESEAIGIFTKLHLKSEFDSIKDAVEERPSSGEAAELRKRFESLIFETVDAIGDRDPGLFSDLLSLRQRMWATLFASADDR